MTELAEALEQGELEVVGRLAEASNLALLCEVTVGTERRRCIYKPQSGERPLWDFPGVVLGRREVLTAQVAACLGWDLVPRTVWREDGPLGPGMCQEWIDETGDAAVALFPEGQLPGGWRPVAEGRTGNDSLVVLAHEDSADLRRFVVLDELVNNADRKGGHLLRRADGRLAGVDHGLSFHPEPKLRTVLWGWAGDPIDPWLGDEIEAGRAAVTELLRAADLTAREVRAATRRLRRVLTEGTFPVPSGQWPALPWPPI